MARARAAGGAQALREVATQCTLAATVGGVTTTKDAIAIVCAAAERHGGRLPLVLRVGDKVEITGLLYTGRDAVHKYLHEGGKPPVDLTDSIIYHCGPVVVQEQGKWVVKAAGPTTSIREEPYQGPLMEQYGEIYGVYDWHEADPSGRVVFRMVNRRDHPSGKGVLDFPVAVTALPRDVPAEVPPRGQQALRVIN